MRIEEIWARRRFVFMDGAMGTELQKRGLQPGQKPELAALAAKMPGQRCFVRTPAQWDGMQGSYLQPFGMVKWYDREKGALWGEETQGYMGLGFD